MVLGVFTLSVPSLKLKAADVYCQPEIEQLNGAGGLYFVDLSE